MFCFSFLRNSNHKIKLKSVPQSTQNDIFLENFLGVDSDFLRVAGRGGRFARIFKKYLAAEEILDQNKFFIVIKEKSEIFLSFP